MRALLLAILMSLPHTVTVSGEEVRRTITVNGTYVYLDVEFPEGHMHFWSNMAGKFTMGDLLLKDVQVQGPGSKEGMVRAGFLLQELKRPPAAKKKGAGKG